MHESTSSLHKSPRPQLRVVHAAPYHGVQGQDFPLHQHKTWEVIYHRSGSIEYCVGGEVCPGQSGVVLSIPPGVIHGDRAWTAYSSYCLAIEATAGQPWPMVCYDDGDGTFAGVCSSLVREFSGRSPGREEMIALLLDQLDILLRRAHEQVQLSETERLVREAERLLQGRSSGPVTIQQIACELGVSSSSLRAQFVRLRGQTPSAHLQNVRVQHALALLRNSSAPLQAIAHACGYDSASHLSRHVKRATGTSPGALRTR